MTEQIPYFQPAPLSDTVAAALRRAFSLGQTYWQQADSESYSQHAKSDITRGKFDALLEETTAAVVAIQAPEGGPREALQELFEPWWEKSGQFCRAGGGGYEKTFAFYAWEAALSAALAAQPEQETWAGAGAFIQHVQVAAGLAGSTGHWPDEFLAWYQPEKWLGEHRGAAVFLGQKFAAQAPAEGDERAINTLLCKWTDECVEALKPRPATPSVVAEGDALAEVCAFLDGSGTLEGVWFSETHPTKKGAFWWRTNLRAALASKVQPKGTAAELTDADIERIAVKHEAFGFGLADPTNSQLTTHGFDPDGLRNFARALIAATQSPAPAPDLKAQALALCHALEDQPGSQYQTAAVLAAFKVYRAFESIEQHGEIRQWVFDVAAPAPAVSQPAHEPEPSREFVEVAPGWELSRWADDAISVRKNDGSIFTGIYRNPRHSSVGERWAFDVLCAVIKSKAAGAQAPAVGALTVEQRESLWQEHWPHGHGWGGKEWHRQGIEDAERAHGIGESKPPVQHPDTKEQA